MCTSDAAAVRLLQGVTVRLLNERMWPAFREDRLVPPLALQQVVDAFNRYYDGQQTSNAGAPKIQLNWLLTQGNATVKPLYGGKSKGFGHKAFSKFKLELVNPYQLAILMLFNEKDKWTAPELEGQLGIKSAELRKYLDSLARPKIKALLRIRSQYSCESMIVQYKTHIWGHSDG